MSRSPDNMNGTESSAILEGGNKEEKLLPDLMPDFIATSGNKEEDLLPDFMPDFIATSGKDEEVGSPPNRPPHRKTHSLLDAIPTGARRHRGRHHR